MGRFVRGDIVVVPFPLKEGGEKRRPALILAEVAYGGSSDYLVCMISSQNDPNDQALIPIGHSDATGTDFMANDPAGSSYIRPSYLWTMVDDVAIRKLDSLSPEKTNQALNHVRSLLD